MEIIDRGNDSGRDLVQIAFADTREEAALIRGLLREEGIKSLVQRAGPGARGSASMVRSPCRIYVRPERAEAARKLIGETMVEDPLETEIPESANAGYLADASGRRPRDYSVLGAYTRAWLAAFAVLGAVLLIFLVLK
ncbi:MAG: DUF2007 domain-containing protein [Actinobacteria bacterium]|nr:DUF2007 domain-containing protein [Actinomycetota bacterium]